MLVGDYRINDKSRADLSQEYVYMSCECFIVKVRETQQNAKLRATTFSVFVGFVCGGPRGMHQQYGPKGVVIQRENGQRISACTSKNSLSTKAQQTTGASAKPVDERIV